ncbi:hypothetical protein VOLCADRAFT_97490 [Volvox carteri f. nagariensis]|uniref:Protein DETOXIFICATION n=1 Tax=Volvox carteri f. nagariensis TaxID=3068 RepID=D8UCV9_VOLCA|nr:uncharacterized protein VOLCADRAFT_97490 [Volvox carteri f. nagariensis]EFJ42410.1 hypothetical protein VOLCADRAFT_97490 [Volvox carteri f. nagariensis]|eukprot:XP_002956473.1 hypothetical protein VOLCADRAFT_97490 [Volvox carteri f. nagariensis]
MRCCTFFPAFSSATPLPWCRDLGMGEIVAVMPPKNLNDVGASRRDARLRPHIGGSQTMVVTDQIFVGHLGVTQLAAAALGNTYFNLMWFFLLGCSTALDTLGSQAYGGNDYSSLLTWTYTAGLVLSALCGVMAVGLWYAREVAVFLFLQPPEVAEQVALFCRWLIPGLWPMMWSVVLMKFMQTQNCMLAPAVVAASTCAFNVLSNAVFVHYLGFIGAPIATSVSRFVQLFVYLGVVLVLQHKNHPGGWGRWLARSRRCWTKALSPGVLYMFMQLGIPGGCMLALEAGSFEITTAFAGALGIQKVSAHSTLLGVCTYTFISFPFAVATAATIRVGNLLGAGRTHQASLAATLCVLSGTIFQGTCGVVMFLLRSHLGFIFTSDPEVVAIVSTIVIFGVAFQFCDGAFGTSQGVLRGMGRQHQLMLYNLIGFWLMGVAFGWWLTFKAKLGLTGLWIGIDTGDLVAAGLCVVTWLLVDWKKEVAKAQQQMAVAHDHKADVGHVEGEPDDWHDFLLPYKHESLTGIDDGNCGGGGGGDGGAAAQGLDPFSQALLGQSPCKNPFGSPRFASPRFRGA